MPALLVVLSAGSIGSALLLLPTPRVCSWLFRSGHWGFLVYVLFVNNIMYLKGFPGSSMVKNPTVDAGEVLEEPLDKGMATHSNILA